MEDDKKISKVLGQTLKRERLARRMSQEKMAESGLTPTYISELERGLKSPTVNSVFRICKILSIEPSEFFKKIEIELESDES